MKWLDSVYEKMDYLATNHPNAVFAMAVGVAYAIILGLTWAAGFHFRFP